MHAEKWAASVPTLFNEHKVTYFEYLHMLIVLI